MISGDQLCRLFPADENIDIAAIAHKAKVKYRAKRDRLGEDALRQLGARNGDRSAGSGRGACAWRGRPRVACGSVECGVEHNGIRGQPKAREGNGET